MKRFFLIVLLSSASFSSEIIFNTIKEYKINSNKLDYIIEAKEKKIDFKKLKKIRFFNIEKKLSDSSFYLNGKFRKKNLEINFKKAYFYKGSFIMHEIKGRVKDFKIEGKSAKFKDNKIIFEKVYLTKNKRRMRKIRLEFEL